MAAGFDELELLSNEELVFEALRRLLRAYYELRRRGDDTREFLRSLCGFSLESRAWFILWEGGGPQRFTDLLPAVGCSRPKLSDVLRELLRAGLVRMVGKRYQAIAPAWLVNRS